MDHRRDARGVAAGDFDRDGDVDFIINNYRAPAAYWVNSSAAGQGWVAVKAPVGTWLEVEAGGRRYGRLVTAGSGYAGQDSREQIIGLGSAQEGALSVVWPGGERHQLGTVQSGERRTLKAPARSIHPLCTPKEPPGFVLDDFWPWLALGVAGVLGALLLIRRRRWAS